MTDGEVLAFLIKKFGSQAEAARALGISDQRFHIWKAERGISARMRPKVREVAREKGMRLPERWIWDRPQTAA